VSSETFFGVAKKLYQEIHIPFRKVFGNVTTQSQIEHSSIAHSAMGGIAPQAAEYQQK
jgi:hypothetical protein